MSKLSFSCTQTLLGELYTKEKVPILDDIEFELELIHRDEINVSYIIALLRNMQSARPAEQEKERVIEKIKEFVETFVDGMD